MEFSRTCHQAHQVDFNHLAKSGHFEFAAAVDHRTLRQHQHIEPVERRLEILDRLGIADIELRVIQVLKLRSLGTRIMAGRTTSPADMDRRAFGAKGLRDAVADAATAADHENLLSAKVQFVHRGPPVALCRKHSSETQGRNAWPISESSAARLRD